jgi:hypothetical protein
VGGVRSKTVLFDWFPSFDYRTTGTDNVISISSESRRSSGDRIYVSILVLFTAVEVHYNILLLIREMFFCFFSAEEIFFAARNTSESGACQICYNSGNGINGVNFC